MVNLDEEIPKITTPEKDDYVVIEDMLSKVGWESAKNYGIQENQFIEDFIEWSIFEKAFKKINEDQMKDLKEEKKNEILSYVKDRLKD
ncbi:MAG: hypothetical protein ACP5SE_05250, partial [Nitrososphaeria archaeon]